MPARASSCRRSVFRVSGPAAFRAGGQCRGYPDQPFGPGGEAFGGDFTARGGEVPFAEFGPDGLRDELQGALRRGCAQRGQHGDQGE